MKPWKNRVAMVGLAAMAAAAAWAGEESLVERQLVKLTKIERLYVETLAGDDAGTIRDLLIGALHRKGLFILVDRAEAADAVLRGSAENRVFEPKVVVREAAAPDRRGSKWSPENLLLGGAVANETPAPAADPEPIKEALAAVRVVSNDGEVLWATTRESRGGKYRGPAAQVAQRVADDLARAWRKTEAPAADAEPEAEIEAEPDQP